MDFAVKLFSCSVFYIFAQSLDKFLLPPQIRATALSPLLTNSKGKLSVRHKAKNPRVLSDSVNCELQFYLNPEIVCATPLNAFCNHLAVIPKHRAWLAAVLSVTSEWPIAKISKQTKTLMPNLYCSVSDTKIKFTDVCFF